MKLAVRDVIVVLLLFESSVLSDPQMQWVEEYLVR